MSREYPMPDLPEDGALGRRAHGEARRTRARRSIEEYVLLLVCMAGALGIAPFAINRLLLAETLLGAVDASISVVMASLAVFVWRTRRIRLASVVLSFVCVSGMVTVVYLKGPSLVYWAYPTMATAFFLLTEREAIAINVLAMAALAPALLPRMTGSEFSSIQVTLALTTLFAYIFAALTSSHRRQLSLLVMKDALTGVGNRRAFEEKVIEVMAARRRTGQAASLLSLDLDHFKNVNDTHGHETGDRILCRVSELIVSRIRITDGLFRVGGEEFVVIAVGADLAAASRLAEQIRLLVEKSRLLPDQPLTVSFGVAELAVDRTAAECIRRADSALYEAKRSGRNAVRVAS
jgi:diguanylate cyclase